ncbi:UDP-glycosyltransferase UGT5-like [Phymastichus coffea]|uniref:UDP-glycosyltransferase UGT5-like n=1 Tax=Phymastichus coffea TaxID=108790 RepID=UPI00273AFDEC|nr:UDP-glycosyltransferase UGT5-like [Phymastichus coffea]
MALITRVVIALACLCQCIDGLRILGLFPLHGKSHFVMCERLMKGLAEKGHQIDVYSHFPQKKPVPNYNDFSLDGTLPKIVNNMSYDVFKQFQTVNMEIMMKEIANPVCDLLDIPIFQKLIQDLKTNQPYDVVIIEVFISNCFLAWGRHLNIPMVGIMTSTLFDWYNEPLGNPMNTAVTPAVWSGLFHPMSFWQRLSNTLLYWTVSGQFNYYIRDQNRYVEKHFGKDYPDVTDLPKDLDLLLINSHLSLDGVRSFTPSIIPVAGVHIDDDAAKLPAQVQKWLDDSKHGCIYFSFGSMVRIETFPRAVLDAFYASFQKLAPVRVLMKIAKPEVLPPGLPSNVMTQPWFSQLQVLKHKHVIAFVTHGGLMSTLESIYAAVPMVGIPCFGDQTLNVQTQVQRKTATSIKLDEITESSVTWAIREVIQNPIYKKNVERLSKKFLDRPMSAMDTAIFWIEYVTRHGKKALRAPVVDMPWWQAHLIDVYAFIAFTLVVAYYLLKCSLKLIIRRCCRFSKNAQSKKVKKH